MDSDEDDDDRLAMIELTSALKSRVIGHMNRNAMGSTNVISATPPTQARRVERDRCHRIEKQLAAAAAQIVRPHTATYVRPVGPSWPARGAMCQ